MDEQKMNELYELTKENHRMLKAIRRDAFVGGIFKFVWWVVILVVIPYFTCLYLQPYLNDVAHTYNSVKTTTNTVQAQTSGGFAAIENFFKQFEPATTTKK